MSIGSPDIRSLRSVEIATPALDEATEFYSGPWGLDVISAERDATWFRAAGPEHHVLALRRSEHAGLGKLSFAMADKRSVDEAAARFDCLGLPLLDGPGNVDGPAGGYALMTADIEGRRVELLAESNAVTRGDPSGSRPLGVTHVVLNTVDIDAAVMFWQEVFGFRLSDWSEHQMAFLRCNTYHHAIAFNQASWTSINHVAFEMASVDDFMRGVGRLRQAGHPAGWGPGRHGPGDNTFAYFVDPSGVVCEYTSEVARVDESTWIPRVWARTPELSDTWGTAGAPSADIRRHMAGEADPWLSEKLPSTPLHAAPDLSAQTPDSPDATARRSQL